MITIMMMDHGKSVNPRPKYEDGRENYIHASVDTYISVIHLHNDPWSHQTRLGVQVRVDVEVSVGDLHEPLTCSLPIVLRSQLSPSHGHARNPHLVKNHVQLALSGQLSKVLLRGLSSLRQLETVQRKAIKSSKFRGKRGKRLVVRAEGNRLLARTINFLADHVASETFIWCDLHVTLIYGLTFYLNIF